jgi:hypothetical protein
MPQCETRHGVRATTEQPNGPSALGPTPPRCSRCNHVIAWHDIPSGAVQSRSRVADSSKTASR